MSNLYISRGKTLTPTDSADLVIVDHLPTGTYSLGASPAGFHFTRIDDFVLPSKIYGDVEKTAERILTTFLDRPAVTGVMAEGEKGSGKTMLAKLVATKARALEIPTVIINSAFCGEAFNELITNMKQPVILIFDEFEKVYDSDEQGRLLTVLDGTYASKKLAFFCCNEYSRVNAYMRNRPGRIYYALSYNGLDTSFVRDYCQDRLVNKDLVDAVCRIALTFNTFNFDMLQAMVEEMNRYGESATETLKFLNVRGSGDRHSVFDIIVKKDGAKLDAQVEPGYFIGNPTSQDGIGFTVFLKEGAEPKVQAETVASLLESLSEKPSKPKKSKKSLTHVEITLNREDIKGIDAETGAVSYEKDDYTIELVRRVPKTFEFCYENM